MLARIAKYIYRKPQQWLIRGMAKSKATTLDTATIGKALIVSPHPDDEVFGCGELIRRLCCEGKMPVVLFLSRGEAIASEYRIDSSKITAARECLTRKALNLLGVRQEDIHYLDFPDGHFAETPHEQKEKLLQFIQSGNFQCMFVPHPWDGSPDHVAATELINELSDFIRIPKYYYCVWLWHHMKLIKCFRLRFSKSMLLSVISNKKKEAIDIYASATDDKGNYYSGRLPEMFLQAVSWNNELYFNE